MSARVKKALQYGKSLAGTKYNPWKNGQDTRATEAPFWASNAPAPAAAYVKARSCLCAGLINLMRRKVGLGIPGAERKDYKYAGGTWIWFNHLKKRGVLEAFDINKKYPAGTLLLRNYKSVGDQGHVAVIVTPGRMNVLYSTLLHCYTAEPKSGKKKQSPGIDLDQSVGRSHFWRPEGYYTHACLPQHWLGRD